MSWLMIIALIGLVIGNFCVVWKLWGILRAFDDVIIKTLTDTTVMDKNKIFIDVLSKFGENDRKRKDKEFSSMREILKIMELDVKNLRNTIELLRKDR